MAKKTFKSGLDSLLQTTRPTLAEPTPQQPLPTLPATATEPIAPSATPPAAPTAAKAIAPPSASQSPPHESAETRATFIVDVEQLEQLRAYAYWERLQLKEALYQALDAFLSPREIAPIPDKKRK